MILLWSALWRKQSEVRALTVLKVHGQPHLFIHTMSSAWTHWLHVGPASSPQSYFLVWILFPFHKLKKENNKKKETTLEKNRAVLGFQYHN